MKRAPWKVIASPRSLRQTFLGSVRLLWTRRFGTFVSASLLSNIGTWAQQVAQPWLMLSLGASSLLLGIDQFAMNGPAIFLLLAGGLLADSADRRRVITLFQSIQMLCPTLIVALLVFGAIEPWMIIVCSFVVGVTDALSMPSFSSIVPTIVERDQIPAGMALNSTQFNISRILGPAIAGSLMATIGAIGCFAVSAASYIPFILIALWVLPRTAPSRDQRHRLAMRELSSGLREITREPALRGAILTVAITNLFCAPLITFAPVLVRNVLNGDVGEFSAVVSALGLGGLAGAMGLLFVRQDADRRPLSSWSGVSYGVAVFLCALAPSVPLLVALFVVAGITMAGSNVSANTFLQTHAPARIRGQTISLYMLAMRGGVACGSLLTGLSVTVLGVREALVLNGALAVVLQLAIGRFWMKSLIAEARN